MSFRNVLVFLALALAGCTGDKGLLRPPGLLGVPRATTTAVSGANVTIMTCESVDPVEKVGEFYQSKYQAEPGWKSSYKKGAEIAQWSDGNIQAINTDDFKPKNPKKPGHLIWMFPKAEGCIVILVTSRPNP